MNLIEIKEFLENAGVEFQEGLSEAEISNIQSTYDFEFPPDLKEFLSFALPVSDSFPNWREASQETIMSRLNWPYDGMCFDIKHNSFWHPDWVSKPDDLDKAYAIAKEAVNKAPKLIPVYSHRYIPETPKERGNPVMSVYQTDIIYYGNDLVNYLRHEFHPNHMEGSRTFLMEAHKRGIKEVDFWDDIINGYNLALMDKPD